MRLLRKIENKKRTKPAAGADKRKNYRRTASMVWTCLSNAG